MSAFSLVAGRSLPILFFYGPSFTPGAVTLARTPTPQLELLTVKLDRFRSQHPGPRRVMTDLGLFGPGSMVWRIHADPASLVGGLRALLIQALHPVAMAAVAQNSNYRDDPWSRLMRTSEYLSITTFGDTASAQAAGARLRSIHKSIKGVDPVTGRAYRADDPDLLLWVHNVEVHSFLKSYRVYAGPIDDRDADRYVREMVRHAELVGLRPEEVPHSSGGLREYLRAFEGLALTQPAREGMRYVLAPPMPLVMRPLWTVAAAGAVAILPRKIRELYGMPWVAPAAPVVRAATYTLLRSAKLLLPPPPPVRDALERAERMAA